jgi:CheY-like chemotaxis protein
VTATDSSVELLFVSGDLFLGSRVRASAEAHGRTLDVAGSGPLALDRIASGTYRLVLVDLETPGLRIGELVESVRAQDDPPTMVAYGPHVHEARLEAARQAGCDQVLTRGQFDKSLPVLMSELL